MGSYVVTSSIMKRTLWPVCWTWTRQRSRVESGSSLSHLSHSATWPHRKRLMATRLTLAIASLRDLRGGLAAHEDVLIPAKLTHQPGPDLVQPGNQLVNVPDRLVPGLDRPGAALPQRRDRRGVRRKRVLVAEVLPGADAEADQPGQLFQPGRGLIQA